MSHGRTSWDDPDSLTPPDPEYEQELWERQEEADAIRADKILTERYEKAGE